MKFICSFLACLLAFQGQAQFRPTTINSTRTLVTGAAGNWQPIDRNAAKLELKEGSPFFDENWHQGSIATPDHRILDGIEVKIDLLENQIFCRDSLGREYLIKEPLNEVLLKQSDSAAALHFIHGNKLPTVRPGWYQIIVNDTISLVKGWTKSIDRRVTYNNGVETRVLTTISYWIYFYYQDFKVSKPADFLRVFPSHQKEIQKHIDTLSDKLPLEEKLVSIVSFCNRLTGLKRF